jgi:hypothetical protein
MNMTLLLNKASQEVERVKMQVAVDAKAAQLAHELARAAKVNLKQARKLSKMARKSTRKAEDRAEESSATLETARAKLEMLRERIRNERRKNDPAQSVRGSEPVQKPSPKSKPAALRANGVRRSAQKIVNGKPAKPAPAVTPEPKPVPVTRQKLGDLNPLPAPDFAAPSFSGQVPTDD